MSYSLYGVDLMLSTSGTILANNKGDLYNWKDYEKKHLQEDQFEGYYQVFNKLTKRLLTTKGDDIFFPQYGSNLKRLLGKGLNSANIQQIKEEVKNTLLEDELVSQVNNVSIEVNGKYVNISVKVTLIGKSEQSNFVFPRMFIEG